MFIKEVLFFFFSFLQREFCGNFVKAVTGNNAPFQHNSLKGERTVYNVEKQINE